MIKTRTKIILLSGIIFIGCIIYALFYFHYLSHLVGLETAEASQLSYLHKELFIFHENNHGWPNSLKDVVPDEINLFDGISKKPLLYYPDAKYDTDEILLAQPEPYRTRLWPFGKMRRWGVLANGIRVDLNEGNRKLPQ